MKLSNCEAWNFGSYSHIKFDMSDIGLGLVYGKTGSGKSMLADLPVWILFGITAKNGAADDVRSWCSPDEPTKGVIDVQLSEGSITVVRIRGRAGQNDLYWTESSACDEKKRGKDLAETQRLLSNRLGVDAILYLSASYFCDFSPSGQFFVAKAQARRELFEKIASLELPVKLAERTAEARKTAKKELEKSEMDLAKADGRLEQLEESLASIEQSRDEWEGKRKTIEYELRKRLSDANKDLNKVIALEAKMEFIKEELKEIESLKEELEKAQDNWSEEKSIFKSKSDEFARLDSVGDDRCPTCMMPQEANGDRYSRLEELSQDIKRLKIYVENAKAKVDRIQEALKKEDVLRQDWNRTSNEKDRIQREAESAQAELDNLDTENPFEAQFNKLKENSIAASIAQAHQIHAVKMLESKVARLSRLYDLSFDLRGELLKKAVKQIETSTNDYLEKYFDAELRVTFDLDSDDLDVTIQKSGFVCSYKQLSKGQRQLLKLCFSASIMETSANAAGMHFENLFFDESLDGLDDDLKVKAFGLFEKLESEHNSVLLIDHAPAFQNLFAKKFHVTMDSDVSSIEQEYE